MKTEETNKLIAEFLNELTINSEGQIKEDLEKLDFHYNWNSLMRAVEKIKSLVSESEFNYRIGKHLLNLNIEGVYNGCTSFIKWYNTQILEVIANKTKNKFGNEK